MADVADIDVRGGATPGAINTIIEQHNKLVDALRQGGDGLVLGEPNLRIGTSSKTDVKNDAVNVYVRGEKVTVSAGETAFTATTHDIADPDADPREAYYTLSVDSSGSITITKGSDAAADAATKPAGPADEVVIGWVLIQHDGSAIFNATTDNLDASHLTVTYEDAAGVSKVNP